MYRVKFVITTTQGVEVYKKDIETLEELEKENESLLAKVTHAFDSGNFLMLPSDNCVIGIDPKAIVSFKLSYKEVQEKTEEEEDEEKSVTTEEQITKGLRKSLIKGKS